MALPRGERDYAQSDIWPSALLGLAVVALTLILALVWGGVFWIVFAVWAAVGLPAVWIAKADR